MFVVTRALYPLLPPTDNQNVPLMIQLQCNDKRRHHEQPTLFYLSHVEQIVKPLKQLALTTEPSWREFVLSWVIRTAPPGFSLIGRPSV